MSVKLVISGGDSFTFGSELSDIDETGKTLVQLMPSKFSWADLVAQKLKAIHINTAWPSRSNSFITRHIIHEVSKALHYNQNINSGILGRPGRIRPYRPNEIFVQVMWTYLGRHEVLVNNLLHEYDRGGKAGKPGTGPIYYDRPDSPWFNVDPHSALDDVDNKLIGFANYIEEYYKVTGELTDHYISLKEILFLQEFLENRNIKYMFTYVHSEVIDQLTGIDVKNEYTTDLDTPIDIIDELRREIKFDEWFSFSSWEMFDRKSYGGFKRPEKDYIGFWNWAAGSQRTSPTKKRKKYKFGPGGHPLEQAHIDAAEIIYDHISNLWG